MSHNEEQDIRNNNNNDKKENDSSNRIDKEINEKFDRMEDHYQNLKEGMDGMKEKYDRMEDQYCKIKEEMNKVKSTRYIAKNDKEYEQNDDNTEIDIIEDAFTFIMINPFSLPAATSYLIYFIQIASYLLILSHHYTGVNDDSNFAGMSSLEIPKGVDEEVHAGQGIGILLIVIINDSLWEPIVDFRTVDTAHLETQGIKVIWWVISNLLRLTGGLLLTIVIFFLVIESDDVVELFKDFTAAIFISSFDNMLYSLAKLNILGTRMKKFVDSFNNISLRRKHTDSQTTEVHIVRKCLSFLFHPSCIMSVLLITMYTSWAIYIVLPQRNGNYLCQKFYLQLDDEVDSKLPFFSGSYDLQRGNQKRDFYQTYKENKDCIESDRSKRAMVFRYCKERSLWALSFEDNEDRSNECKSDKIIVKSAEVSLQAKFNVFEVSSDDWFVKNPEDGRWMPLKDFHLSCQHQGTQYTKDMIDNACPELVVDERNDAFVSTRSWSTNFTQMVFPNNEGPVQVYSHPVYFSPGSNNEYDLLFFVGKRWIITSSALLEMRELTRNEFEDKTVLQNLPKYLNDTFHGYWSTYRVAFFSEPVLIDTPQDTLTPAGLNWFSAIDDNNTKQVDDDRQQSSVLICSLCNATSNPCFYEGICHPNKTCECTSGSSGTLCQVLPTQNGLCDETFNNREFNFDGGDCCINTCVSTDDYICGIDKSGKFYVGYDRCEVESCNDCWKTSTSIHSSSFTGMIVTYVSLSANGRALALIESISSTVRVYDIDGSKWIMRGSAVTTSLQPTLDKVDVSEIDYILNRKGSLSPLTVAVRINSILHVFDWRDGIWEETENNIFSNASLYVEDVQLRNNGKSLGVLYKDNSFSLFERFNHLVPWEGIRHITNNNYKSFSFSENGKTIIMANKTCIDVYTRHKDESPSSSCFTQDIKKVQVSRGGQSVAVFTEDKGINGDIFTFTISGHNLTSLNGVLRGVPFQDASIGITDRGENIAVHSSSDNLLRFFKWEENRWKRQEQTIHCKSMYASNENSVIAVVPTRQVISSGTLGDSVKVYHKETYCGDGMSKLRLTFVPDSKPTELSWEILDIDSEGNMKTLASGGPYSIPQGTVTHELCINDNEIESTKSNQCIALRLLDEGLDGLQIDGVIGFSLNGAVKFSIDKTYGYNNTYPILGNMDCLSDSKNNVFRDSWRYDERDHTNCFTADCEWVESKGLSNTYLPTAKLKLISMSADGSVFATAIKDEILNRYRIQILQSDENDVWNQLGSDIIVLPYPNPVRFYSLSADGSVIAVCSREASYKPGKVIVYMYNAKKGEWSQKGNDIHINVGLTSDDDLIINSAGNQILVSGLNETVGIETQYCAVQSFIYTEVINEWAKQGSCIFSTNITAYHNIAMSSNGLVVAVSQLAFESPSFVKIYSLDIQSGEWIQQGNEIKESGSGQFIGVCIGMSSDGSIVALGGSNDYPVRVYKLDENHEWLQFGYDISIPSARQFILATISASGLTLALPTISASNQIMTHMFVYDEVSELWIQSPMSLPLVNVSSHLAMHAVSPFIAASADLRTISFQSGYSIKIYRLIMQSTNSTRSCYNNEIAFNFTIKPDQFPVDIEWLFQTKNDIIIGGRLPFTLANREVNYKRCIPKTNSYFVFSINDRYGDGLCCEWGDGYFTLEWDEKKVMDSFDFKKSKTLCLSSDNSEMSLLTIHFDIYPQNIMWTLLDSDNEKIMEGSGSDGLEKEAFSQCLSSIECFYLVVEDFTGHGVPYNITYADNNIHQNESFYLDRVKIGNCQTKICSQEQSLIEFYFVTNGHYETFTWEVINGNNNSVVDSSDGLYETRSLIFYERCISISADECLFLRLIDMNDDENVALRSTIYSVEVNGNLIHNNMTLGGFEMVNIFGACNDYYCKDNAFFQLWIHLDYFGKGNSSNENSWELLHNGTALERSVGKPPSWEGLFLNDNKYYFHKCLSVDTHTCLTLQLKDSGADGGNYYLVNYNGHHVDVGFQTNDLLEIKMGSCARG